MSTYLILLGLIISVIAIILCIKHKQFGILIIIIGIILLCLSYFGRLVFESFADNPGIMWISPDGIPYSDIYSKQANAMNKWIIGSGVLILLGLLLTIKKFISQRKK